MNEIRNKIRNVSSKRTFITAISNMSAIFYVSQFWQTKVFDAKSSRAECPTKFISHCCGILFVEHVLKCHYLSYHYSNVMMVAMASQITGVSIVWSTFCSGTDQRKPQSSASLAFVKGNHRRPVDSPHKGPVTWKKCFHLMTSCVLYPRIRSSKCDPGYVT